MEKILRLPLAKPFVLVALVELAMAVCVMVGLPPRLSRVQLNAIGAAPSAKTEPVGGMVSAIPADGAVVAAAPAASVETNTPEVLKFIVPEATVVVAPAPG